MSDKSWEPGMFWKLENFENMKNDPWDMLNNFCFQVYAQKSKLTQTRAGSLAVRRGFLTLTLTLSHSLPLYPTLSLTHSISVSLYHSFSLSLSRSFSHSLSRSNFLHNFLLMTFGTTFILIPKLKSCILTYRHIDIRTYWHTDMLTYRYDVFWYRFDILNNFHFDN